MDTAVGPARWLYEVTNVSMLAVCKGRITKAKATKFLADLTNLPIEVEPAPTRESAFPVLTNLMERHRLTAYDAAYLELVIRRQLPIATLGTALLEACKSLGEALI